MSLGDKITALRKSRGMSQEQLGEHLSVSRQAVSKWELNESVPDVDKVVQLSKLFGVTTDYLINDEPASGGGRAYYNNRRKQKRRQNAHDCKLGCDWAWCTRYFNTYDNVITYRSYGPNKLGRRGRNKMVFLPARIFVFPIYKRAALRISAFYLYCSCCRRRRYFAI